MPTANIMVGNIGCGKSLISSKLAKLTGAVVVNMDTLQQMMSGGEYGSYDAAKKDVYQATERTAIKSALAAGRDVVIDRTNVDTKRRARYIEMVREYTGNIVCYDFGAGREDDLLRRTKNPRGISTKKWAEVFAYMKGNYEYPMAVEGFSEIIYPPDRFEFHAFDFDGTICRNTGYAFPEIGEIIDGTVEMMNRLYQNLSNIIIVWTCRSGDYENQMREFLLKEKIPFDFINENPMFETGSRKIFAHNYFDDRNALVGEMKFGGKPVSAGA